MLAGQQEHRQARGHVYRSGLENTLKDVRIHRKREVRSVLFGRSDGQNGYRALRVERCKVGGAQVAPMAPVGAELGW